MPTLKVIDVQGRLPYHPRPLHPENIRVDVRQRDADTVLLRLDDTANPELWLEVTVHIQERCDESH